MSTPIAQFRLSTPLNSGAIAVFEMVGNIENILGRVVRSHVNDRCSINVGDLRLCHFVDGDGNRIDTGIVARASANHVQLMPHGGPRVVQRMRRAIRAAGAEEVGAPLDAVQKFWPEAGSDRVEALMLETIGRASSRDAIDLLLAQPRWWRRYFENHGTEAVSPSEIRRIRERSKILNRLVTPPVVVVVGPPNVGKSTLTNKLVGRAASIATERSGTTRDYVGALGDLGGLAVWWCDTPGQRVTDDENEKRAIELAERFSRAADYRIEASAPDVTVDDSDRHAVHWRADLRVMLKSDLMDRKDGDSEGGLRVCAQTGAGMGDFVTRVREGLVSANQLKAEEPWLFDERIWARDERSEAH